MRNDVFQDCISALMCWASMILYTDWLPAFYRYWTWLMNNGRPNDCACECKSMQKLRWCFSELSPSLIRNITHVVFCMTFSLLYMTIHSQHIFCGPDSARCPWIQESFFSEVMALYIGGDVPGIRRWRPWTQEALSLDTGGDVPGHKRHYHTITTQDVLSCWSPIISISDHSRTNKI